MDTGHHAYTRFEPAGVVAAVAPWNFPLMLESWKVGREGGNFSREFFTEPKAVVMQI